jgi:hypothetical protein
MTLKSSTWMGIRLFPQTIISETPCMFRVGEVLRLWIIYQIGETSYKIYNKDYWQLLMLLNMEPFIKRGSM